MEPKTRVLVFQIPKNTKHITVPEVIDQSSAQHAMVDAPLKRDVVDDPPKPLASPTDYVSRPVPSTEFENMDKDTQIVAKGVQMSYREFSTQLDELLSKIKARAHKEIVLVEKE
ncbi:hypothetical protein AURDEDRAFT_172132 [Auricularia subglabra TFB-10046 SS5]|nr:hypothetical protein AURDEDRAFT_172132 [Auricularia subglabra TFB-10046 SS5]